MHNNKGTIPMINSFGPWTTALNTGSTAELSTFWKRRVGRLASVAESSPRVSWRAKWLLLLAAALMLGWPTLYLSTTVAATADAQPEQPSGEPPVKAPPPKAEQPVGGGPMMVSLPAGVHVEIIGVAEHGVKDKSWWAPDGTPIAAPYQKFRSSAIPSAGNIAREIAIQWHMPAGSGTTAGWSVTPSMAYAGGRPEDANGKPLPKIEAAGVVMPGSQETCTLTFEIAAGEWETMNETDGTYFGSQGVRKHGYSFAPAYESKGSVMITISHNVLEKDVRVIAVDSQGKLLADGGSMGGGAADFRQTTGRFPNLKLKDIHAYRLQARPYQRVEVRDISVRKDLRTTPKVVEIPAKEDET